MRFTIDIVWAEPEDEPVLNVLLYPNDSDILSDYDEEEEVYHCAATVSNDQKQLVGMIMQCVNACLAQYEESKEEGDSLKRLADR